MNLISTICLLARGVQSGGEFPGATAAAWLLLFIILSIKGLSHPIWALCLYIMTMYILPSGWWWGRGTLTEITYRWNFAAAWIFLVGVAGQARIHGYRTDPLASKVIKLLILYTLNATFVHLLFASNRERSFDDLVMVWKQLVLFFLMYWSLATRSDLKKFFYVIVLCSFYVGFEVVINHRGKFSHDRLEGIFIPGAAESNYLAGLFSLTLPLLGALILVGLPRDKIIAVCAAPFVLDVILRCNSRGAFLALLAGGSRMYVASKGRMRQYANYGVALVVVALIFQARDPHIAERFRSIFPIGEAVVGGDNSAMKQDSSSENRIEFWKAALKMIVENPMGSGGEAAFKSDRGSAYIRHLGTSPYRAVHNGFLDISAGWGVQGIALYLAAIFVSWQALRKAVNFNLRRGDPVKAFVGVSIEAALVTQLVVCMFISSLDGEWFYWLMAIMLAYGHLYGPKEGEEENLPTGRIVVTREMMNRSMKQNPFEDPPQVVEPQRQLV